MRDAGAYNISQDQDSSVVFGMPKAAIDANAVHKVVSMSKIARALVDQLVAPLGSASKSPEPSASP